MFTFLCFLSLSAPRIRFVQFTLQLVDLGYCVREGKQDNRGHRSSEGDRALFGVPHIPSACWQRSVMAFNSFFTPCASALVRSSDSFRTEVFNMREPNGSRRAHLSSLTEAAPSATRSRSRGCASGVARGTRPSP